MSLACSFMSWRSSIRLVVANKIWEPWRKSLPNMPPSNYPFPLMTCAMRYSLCGDTIKRSILYKRRISQHWTYIKWGPMMTMWLVRCHVGHVVPNKLWESQRQSWYPPEPCCSKQAPRALKIVPMLSIPPSDQLTCAYDQLTLGLNGYMTQIIYKHFLCMAPCISP